MAAAMTAENADAADDSDNNNDVVFDDEADMVIVAATMRILMPSNPG